MKPPRLLVASLPLVEFEVVAYFGLRLIVGVALYDDQPMRGGFK